MALSSSGNLHPLHPSAPLPILLFRRLTRRRRRRCSPEDTVDGEGYARILPRTAAGGRVLRRPGARVRRGVIRGRRLIDDLDVAAAAVGWLRRALRARGPRGFHLDGQHLREDDLHLSFQG